MDLDYIQLNKIPNAGLLDSILELHKIIFGCSDNLVKQMESKPELLIHVAMEGTNVIGYKIGYGIDNEKFYSWLGGVDQKYRNTGVASKLMGKQHQYLKEQGFKTVQTKTMNKWRSMLILNIKTGFDIIGTYTNEKGEFKIILEKIL